MKILDEQYDSYYDNETGEWLEGKCDNPNCEFCKDRPKKHNTIKLNHNCDRCKKPIYIDDCVFYKNKHYHVECLLETYCHQIKKDKDDGSNDSLSGNPKMSQGRDNKEEQMPVRLDNQSGDTLIKIKKIPTTIEFRKKDGTTVKMKANRYVRETCKK